MALLIVISASYLSRVLSISFLGVASSGDFCVDFDGRDGTFLILGISFIPLAVLFFSLLSLFGALNAVGVLRSWDLLLLGRRLRIFDLWLFYWLVLGTGFGCWRLTTPETGLIDIASIETRLEDSLGFGVDGFFDYFFETIEFSAALLYFDLHWKTKAFSEISNHCIFFLGTIRIKFNQDRL